MPTWVRDLLSHDDPLVRSQVGRQLFGHRGRSRGHGLASGSLVEFTHGGNLCFGAVVRHPGRRLLVVDVRGRERWLRRDKILDLSANRVPTLSRQGALSHLRRIDGQRQARSLAVELQPLWEIAAEEGEGRVWSLEELAELQFGSPAGDDRPVLLRALWHSRFFTRHANGWSPLSREARARTRELESLKKQQEKALAETAAWVRRVADGEAPDPRPANADEAVRLLREAAVFGSGSPRRSEAAALMDQGPPSRSRSRLRRARAAGVLGQAREPRTAPVRGAAGILFRIPGRSRKKRRGGPRGLRDPGLAPPLRLRSP